MFFGNGVDDGQPQPGAFARGLGGKEGLKQLLVTGLGQAWPIVVNIDAQLSVLLTEPHLQSLLTGLQGVAQQIEQGQLETPRVAFHRGQRLRAVGLYLELSPGDLQFRGNKKMYILIFLCL